MKKLSIILLSLFISVSSAQACKTVNDCPPLANKGNSAAQNNLGVMYYNGLGVSKNYVQAYAWVNVAMANGSEKVKGAINIIEKEMTSYQITKAQKLSNELFKKYKNK